MDKKKVTTKGTYDEMTEVTNLDKETIQGGIQVVEQAANMEIEVPESQKN